ncbi:hypothetical protein TSAR_008236 [Trichomalopsis sarcophagae]|uniref:Uncharacterized protein n=1 Tax=Trichomalopsis sarcophagae TaxID=543379 RepID=A0A232ESH3_9HYME|nr:hypothetical protein TSAR_008236 [Trichomalopsis sarcophagae]
MPKHCTLAKLGSKIEQFHRITLLFVHGIKALVNTQERRRDPVLQGPGAQSQPNRDTTQSRQTRTVFAPYSIKLEKAINKPHHVHENGEDFTEHLSLTMSTRTGRTPKLSTSSHTREWGGNNHTSSAATNEVTTDASTRATSHHHQGRATALLNERDLRRHTTLQGPGVGPSYNKSGSRNSPTSARVATKGQLLARIKVSQDRSTKTSLTTSVRTGRIHHKQIVYHCHVHSGLS